MPSLNSVVAFLGLASAFGQGMVFGQVVMDTADVHFHVLNPEPKGSLMEQADKLRKKVKGRVQRYRVFVQQDADTNLLNLTLRAPSLTIVRVAGLPVPGQKLSLEAVTDDGKNPNGLVFISGQGQTKKENVQQVKPMVQKAFEDVDKGLTSVNLAPADVVAVTCYVSSLADTGAVWALGTSHYPQAAYNQVQSPQPFGSTLVECEAVARAKAAIGFVSPEGLVKSPNFTHVAGISSKRMIWSGLHVSKGCTEAGVRSMFQSLNETVKKKGGSLKDTAFSYLYPNSTEGTDLTRKVRMEFYNTAQMPASTLVPFLGFMDKEACAGVEVAVPVK